MNVTAKHGQAAVHIGGHELTNGRWSPLCGTQHHNAGGREVTPLRPTDREVTCKRCLKADAKRTAEREQSEAVVARKMQARENLRKGRAKIEADRSAMDSLREMLTF